MSILQVPEFILKVEKCWSEDRVGGLFFLQQAIDLVCINNWINIQIISNHKLLA